jgi:SagB-type dehydrogenase family enzyme
VADDARISGLDGGTAMRSDRRMFVLALGTLMLWLTGCAPRSVPSTAAEQGAAQERGDLFDAIRKRRSIRDFASGPVSDQQIAIMLRAAQGVTDPIHGLRAAPSAGALYPLEIYVASADGIRRYDPTRDELQRISSKDVRKALATAALGQSFIADAPVAFVITAVYARTAAKYGDRAPRYVHLEAGHAAQNLLLVAGHLGLGGVTVGAFVDDAVRAVVGASSQETPLYVIPVGRPASGSGR